MDESELQSVAEQLALLRELRRLVDLVMRGPDAYQDLQVDYGRPFPEELR